MRRSIPLHHIAIGVMVFGALCTEAAGQDMTVRLVELRLTESSQNERVDFPTPLEWNAAAEAGLRHLRRAGYFHASIDSIRSHPDLPAAQVLFLDEGPRVRLDEVHIEYRGETSGIRPDIIQVVQGEPLDLDRLEQDVARLLAALARDGSVLATVRIADIRLTGPSEDLASVWIEVDPGERAILREIILVGADRTRSRHASRILGLQAGQELTSFDEEEIRARLIDSGLFQDVGRPSLRFAADSVSLIIPLQDEPPGSFDLALGYLPAEVGGAVVGSGHLELLNPFGGGRRFALNLDRLPGATSRLEAEAEDPFLFGVPLRVAGRFGGYQQDSLYHRQRLAVEVGYAFAGGMEVFVTAGREAARPGTAGSRLEGGRQRIARSDARMYGAGVRFTRVDFRRSPTRGLALEVVAERGTNRRSQSRLIDTDTTREHRAVRQDRLTLTARSFLPLGRRGVLVGGMDVRTLLSEEYDRSDLFRIGGLQTMRGYDDDQFMVRTAGRGLVEYRHRLDRLSYLVAFADLAYLERPLMHDTGEFAEWKVGYGIGTQFDTGFSLMNIAVAANPDDGLRAPRIHAGISFGL